MNVNQVRKFVSNLAIASRKSDEQVMNIMTDCHEKHGRISIEILEQQLGLPSGLLTNPVEISRLLKQGRGWPIEVLKLIHRAVEVVGLDYLHEMVYPMIDESAAAYPDWPFIREVRGLIEVELYKPKEELI